jgi:hypothetical protein
MIISSVHFFASPRTNSVTGQGSPPKGFISQSSERERSAFGLGGGRAVSRKFHHPPFPSD